MNQSASVPLKLISLHTFQNPLVAAASGLALRDNHFYTVADDELFALTWEKNSPERFKIITLFPGSLPSKKKARKKAKPDLESIVVLPNGDLLCIPSGSELNRHQGILIKSSNTEIEKVSFELLYAQLRKDFPDLNIEGAIVIGENLRLFQRGNGKFKQNGLIDVAYSELLRGKVKINTLNHIKLDQLNGEDLSFTDAAIFNNQIYFLAVAEDTDSTFLDGDFRGSVLGVMNLAGQIVNTYILDLKHKPEGLCIDDKYFYVVTDDDDRSKPAQLFQGVLPVNRR